MKKINWKIVNAAFWIEIGLSYLLPFRVVDNYQYKVGFPMPFITVYDTEIAAIGVNPFMSMHLNPLGLLINGLVIYLFIFIFVKAFQKDSKRFL